MLLCQWGTVDVGMEWNGGFIVTNKRGKIKNNSDNWKPEAQKSLIMVSLIRPYF